MGPYKSIHTLTCTLILLQYLRSPAVGSRHHPLGVDERASTEVVLVVLEGGLVGDGVRLHLLTPDDPLALPSWGGR